MCHLRVSTIAMAIAGDTTAIVATSVAIAAATAIVMRRRHRRRRHAAWQMRLSNAVAIVMRAPRRHYIGQNYTAARLSTPPRPTVLHAA